MSYYGIQHSGPPEHKKLFQNIDFKSISIMINSIKTILSSIKAIQMPFGCNTYNGIQLLGVFT